MYMAAIPTVYNGRQYRSRLEARWAAYFDLDMPHIQAEYEPFDLYGWIPDFLLVDREKGKYLVEVKPYTGLSEFIGKDLDKILTALAQQDEQAYRIVLLGSTLPTNPPEAKANMRIIGWAGLVSDQTGLFNQGGFAFFPFYIDGIPSSTEQAWIEAGNRVQWKSPRNQVKVIEYANPKPTDTIAKAGKRLNEMMTRQALKEVVKEEIAFCYRCNSLLEKEDDSLRWIAHAVCWGYGGSYYEIPYGSSPQNNPDRTSLFCYDCMDTHELDWNMEDYADDWR